MRLSVLVHREIVQRLKVAAAMERKTMSQVVEDLLGQQLPELPRSSGSLAANHSQEEQRCKTSAPAPDLPWATMPAERGQ